MFSEACSELHRGVISNLKSSSIPLLILANKQDDPSAVTIKAIAKHLKLDSISQVSFAMFGVSSKTGHNLGIAFEWLYHQFQGERSMQIFIYSQVCPNLVCPFCGSRDVHTCIDYQTNREYEMCFQCNNRIF